MKHFIMITDECFERLKKNGTEDLPLGNGDFVQLSYVGDQSAKKYLEKTQPGRGCYVGESVRE